MRQISWSKAIVFAALIGSVLTAAPASAQDYIIQQNQNGFDLPGVSMPQGQDEVRASDGTTCSSAVAGSGAYLDVGVIRGARGNTGNDMATYGRVVVPIGRKPKRLDCAKLYELEVERLRMELQLLKMGVTDAGPTSSTTGAPRSGSETAEVAAPEATDAAGPMQASTVRAPKPRKVSARKKKAGNDWANEGWTYGN